MQFDYEAYEASARMHPMAALRKSMDLPPITCRDARNSASGKYIKTAGLLLVHQRPPTAKGVCFSTMEDETGFLDMVFFPKEFEKFKAIFLNEAFLIVGGVIERDGNSASLMVKPEATWTAVERASVEDYHTYRALENTAKTAVLAPAPARGYVFPVRTTPKLPAS